MFIKKKNIIESTSLYQNILLLWRFFFKFSRCDCLWQKNIKLILLRPLSSVYPPFINFFFLKLAGVSFFLLFSIQFFFTYIHAQVSQRMCVVSDEATDMTRWRPTWKCCRESCVRVTFLSKAGNIINTTISWERKFSTACHSLEYLRENHHSCTTKFFLQPVQHSVLTWRCNVLPVNGIRFIFDGCMCFGGDKLAARLEKSVRGGWESLDVCASCNQWYASIRKV